MEGSKLTIAKCNEINEKIKGFPVSRRKFKRFTSSPEGKL